MGRLSVRDLAKRFEVLPSGRYPHPPRQSFSTATYEPSYHARASCVHRLLLRLRSNQNGLALLVLLTGFILLFSKLFFSLNVLSWSKIFANRVHTVRSVGQVEMPVLALSMLSKPISCLVCELGRQEPPQQCVPRQSRRAWERVVSCATLVPISGTRGQSWRHRSEPIIAIHFVIRIDLNRQVYDDLFFANLGLVPNVRNMLGVLRRELA